VAVDEVAGVPVIAPVEVLIDSPDGRDGEIAKVIGDVPPLAVTGINEVAAALAVRVSDVIANVVDRAAEIESEKVFVAVTDAESVTVTV
jgi:ribosomal protein L24